MTAVKSSPPPSGAKPREERTGHVALITTGGDADDHREDDAPIIRDT